MTSTQTRPVRPGQGLRVPEAANAGTTGRGLPTTTGSTTRAVPRRHPGHPASPPALRDPPSRRRRRARAQRGRGRRRRLRRCRDHVVRQCSTSCGDAGRARLRGASSPTPRGFREPDVATVVTRIGNVIVKPAGGAPNAGMSLICILRHNPALTLPEFHDHWLHHHGPLFQDIPELYDPLLGYEQNHGIDLPDAEYDGVTQQWFESLEAWVKSLEAPLAPRHRRARHRLLPRPRVDRLRPRRPPDRRHRVTARSLNASRRYPAVSVQRTRGRLS